MGRIANSPAKRARVSFHAPLQSAVACPDPTVSVAATMARSAVGAILEPDVISDEVERRRATMKQAILEPDAVGDEAHLHSASLLPPASLPQPTPPAVSGRDVVSLGLFDPFSSDDEAQAPSQRSAVVASIGRAQSLLESVRKSTPPQPGSQTPGSTVPGQASSSLRPATRLHCAGMGQGLFFSDDEEA